MKYKFDELFKVDGKTRSQLGSEKNIELVKEYLEQIASYHFSELEGLKYIETLGTYACKISDNRIDFVNNNYNRITMIYNEKGYMINPGWSVLNEPICMSFFNVENENALVSPGKKYFKVTSFSGNDVVSVEGSTENGYGCYKFKVSIYLNVPRNFNHLHDIADVLEPEYVYDYYNSNDKWFLDNWSEEFFYNIPKSISIPLPDSQDKINHAVLRTVGYRILKICRERITEYGSVETLRNTK